MLKNIYALGLSHVYCKNFKLYYFLQLSIHYVYL